MKIADPEQARDLPQIANWHRKDLLGIRELEFSEIEMILDTAAAFKTVGSRDIKKVPALRGKTTACGSVLANQASPAWAASVSASDATTPFGKSAVRGRSQGVDME